MKLPNLQFSTENIKSMLQASGTISYEGFCAMVLESVHLEIPINGAVHFTYSERMRQIEHDQATRRKQFDRLILNLRVQLGKAHREKFISELLTNRSRQFPSKPGNKYWPHLAAYLNKDFKELVGEFPRTAGMALRARGRSGNPKSITKTLGALESKLRSGVDISPLIGEMVKDSSVQLEIDRKKQLQAQAEAENRALRIAEMLDFIRDSKKESPAKWPKTTKIASTQMDVDLRQFLEIVRAAISQFLLDQKFNRYASDDDVFGFVENFEFRLTAAERTKKLEAIRRHAEKFETIKLERQKINEFKQKMINSEFTVQNFVTPVANRVRRLDYSDFLDYWYSRHTGGER